MNLAMELPPADLLQQALVADCGLTADDLAAIGRTQAREALDFSAAAMKLKLVTPTDLDRARASVLRLQSPVHGRFRPDSSLPVETFGAQLTEQMRMLRTELLLRHDGRERAANVIAVVSPGAGEGRSQMAADLAQAFARMGQPTLLVDADLRHPSQHLRYCCDNRSGLAEAIVEQRPPQFRSIDSSGLLFLLTAGKPTDASVELLSSRAFEHLVETWSQQFQHIIFDSPAAVEFPDAFALGTIARRVLLLNRAHHTSLKANREILRRLESTRAEILGAVLCDF
jgi:receptor protein-tyrosine kinase